MCVLNYLVETLCTKSCDVHVRKHYNLVLTHLQCFLTSRYFVHSVSTLVYTASLTMFDGYMSKCCSLLTHAGPLLSALFLMMFVGLFGFLLPSSLSYTVRPLPLTHTHPHTQSLTHTLTHAHTHSHTHSLTHTHSHTFTHPPTHSVYQPTIIMAILVYVHVCSYSK